jgi:hypothetical protein
MNNKEKETYIVRFDYLGDDGHWKYNLTETVSIFVDWNYKNNHAMVERVFFFNFKYNNAVINSVTYV